jgi:hypothetical protein
MRRRPVLALLLLPWLFFGHGVSPRDHVAAGERALSLASVADATPNPAFRVDGSRDLVRTLAAARRTATLPARHPSPHVVAVPSAALRWVSTCLSRACITTYPRAHRPKRLTIPHNANAPPVRQS